MRPLADSTRASLPIPTLPDRPSDKSRPRILPYGQLPVAGLLNYNRRRNLMPQVLKV